MMVTRGFPPVPPRCARPSDASSRQIQGDGGEARARSIAVNAPCGGVAAVVVVALVTRARAAQRAFETWTQAQVDEAVTAAGWAIVEVSCNRALAERSVR